MRLHTTTSTNWHLVEKLDQVGIKMKREFTTNIEGCPYEITLQIVLTGNDLIDLGFNHDSEEHIAYTLQMNPPECEGQMQFKLWDYITAVDRVMEQHDTSGWTLQQWDTACPFLFDTSPDFLDDEAMQKEREGWV